jgi:hypothetical protein
MDAWWPKLLEAEFKPTLGDNAFAALEKMLPSGSVVGQSPSAPDEFSGWWGYASKDLRDALAKPLKVCVAARVAARKLPRCAAPRAAAKKKPPAVKGRWSRVYCGNGSLKRCRAALQASLKAALPVTRQQVYGKGDCASNAQSSCFDQNRWLVASAIGLDPFPLQNRPTFQQTVELTRSAAR